MDVCLLLKDAVANRTAAAVLKEEGVSCVVCDDMSHDSLEKIFREEKPVLFFCGAWILRPKVDADDLAAFKSVAAHYRKKHKTHLPVCILYHAEDTQVPRVAELSRLTFIVRIPEGAKTSDWTTAILQGLREADSACALKLSLFHKPIEKKPVVQAPHYSEKDFKADYSMESHVLVLAGPLVGRVSGRIDMILKNEQVHQDVKMNGPRDKNARRILVVDWSGVEHVSEQAAHHCFVVLRDLMKNGVYENIHFEHFAEKEPLFSNKTHFELFMNRFCPEE